jgi:hypothetical protein
MRAIDFPSKITPKSNVFIKKKGKNFFQRLSRKKYSPLKEGSRSISDEKFFSRYNLYRGDLMRGIDCAHSRSVKTPPSSSFRENVAFSTIFVRQIVRAKNRKNPVFLRYPVVGF